MNSSALLALALTINGRAVSVQSHGFDEAATRRIMAEVGNAAVPLAVRGQRNGDAWSCVLEPLRGEPQAATLRCGGWLLRLVRPCSSDACRWLVIERRVDDSRPIPPPARAQAGADPISPRKSGLPSFTPP